LLTFLYVLVWLDEAEIGRFAKVFLKSLWRDCLAGPMDEMEGGGSVFGQFLDERCFA
jgi:hypothetical protein